MFKTGIFHVLALGNRLLLLYDPIIYDLVGKELEENLVTAHAIHNRFTTLHGDIHSLTHGEKVAYGTLTQLLLENRPKEELGLPTTLKEVKLDTVPYEDLLLSIQKVVGVSFSLFLSFQIVFSLFQYDERFAEKEFSTVLKSIQPLQTLFFLNFV